MRLNYRWLIPVALVALLTPGIHPAAAEGGDSPARQKARAAFRATLETFIRDRDLTRARAGYEEAIRHDPTYGLPYYNLGVLAEAEEKWEEAQGWFEKFQKLDQTSEYSLRARIELDRLRRIRELEKTPEGRKRRRYDDAMVRARLALRAGLIKASVKEAAEAAALDDTRWEAYALCASGLSSQGLFAEAATFLEKAIQRAPERVGARLREALAQCQREQEYRRLAEAGAKALEAKDYAAAARSFMAAWDLFPKRGEYGIAAGTTLALAREYPKAAEVLTRLRASPDAAIARKARELLASMAEKRVMTVPLSDADRLIEAGGVHLAGGRLDEAEIAFKQAVSSEPNDPRWHAAYALVLSRQRRWPEAEARYRTAARLDPRSARHRANLGATLLQQSKWEDAVVQYREAVRTEPDNPALHDLLGTALLLAKRRLEAIAAFEEALRLEPGNATFRQHLSTAKAAGN